MKTTIVIIGLCVAVMGHASGQTNQIVTRSGDVYKNITIEKRDDSGLTISYAMPGGGLGITKLTFDKLPDDLQKKYNYDPQQAAAFELEKQKSLIELRKRMAADDALSAEYQNKWADEKLEQDRIQRQQELDRKLAEAKQEEAAAQQKQADAAMLQATKPPDQINVVQQQQQW